MFLLLLLLLNSLLLAENSEPRVVSLVEKSDENNVVLIQTLEIEAPLEKVWHAYTTKDGWENWAVPLAEVNLKIGGTIKSNYNAKGIIGDETTITHNIVNFVPFRLLTLQTELTSNFKQISESESKNFFNVIHFEEISEIKTKVVSYGIGYKDNEKYRELLEFFIKGNEYSLNKLISYLEKK